MAFDIIGPYEETYIISAIDYFSRFAFAKVIKGRSPTLILRFLKEIHKKITIMKLISDGTRENKAGIITDWCKREGITRHFTSPHHHQSNGRIERLNRTIQEGLNKQHDLLELTSKLEKTIEVYNSLRHSAIKVSPVQALEPDRSEEVKKKQHEYIIKMPLV